MNHTDDTQRQDIRTLCTHTFEPTPTHPARRCASPALRNQTFCYYHHPTRKPASRKPRSYRQAIHLPLPSGQHSHQHAIYEVVRSLATNQITHRRAAFILNALQIAKRNPPSS